MVGCFGEQPSDGVGGSDGSGDSAASSSESSSSGGSTEAGSASVDSSGTTSTAPECGNAVVEDDEACDDGNADELDGCTGACTLGPRAIMLELVPPPPPAGTDGTITDTASCEMGDGQPRVLGALTGWRGGPDEPVPQRWTVSVGGGCQQIGLGLEPGTLRLAPDATMLAEFGNAVGQQDQWEVECPRGAVPIGISGRIYPGGPPNIVAVRLECGMAVLDLAAPSGVRVDPIASTAWTETTSPGADETSACPPGTVAVGFRGSFDEKAAAIYELGPLCAQPVALIGPP